MLTGQDIVLISSIEWNFNWQGHQEIANRLVQAGNRVLFVENTGVRAPQIGDTKRIVSRLVHWSKSLPNSGVREVLPNLFVSSPLVLPPFGSTLRRSMNRRIFLQFLVRTIEHLNFKPSIVWTYLPTDTVVAVIELLKARDPLVVYYCIADFSELTPHVQDVRLSERAIIAMSDVVFAQCTELANHCESSGKKANVAPFGVDLDVFAYTRHSFGPGAANGSRDPVATSIAALPRPIVGYVGGIHRYVDEELIMQMARSRPHWSWLLVGPVQINNCKLRRQENVHFMGQQPYTELPKYISQFDVGIVPYIRNGYTRTVVPTKIIEYLAMGKPVVSTALPEVEQFNAKHNVIKISTNEPTQFLSALEEALTTATNDTIGATRRQVAALSDWEHRFNWMSEIVEDKLTRRS